MFCLPSACTYTQTVEQEDPATNPKWGLLLWGRWWKSSPECSPESEPKDPAQGIFSMFGVTRKDLLHQSYRCFSQRNEKRSSKIRICRVLASHGPGSLLRADIGHGTVHTPLLLWWSPVPFSDRQVYHKAGKVACEGHTEGIWGSSLCIRNGGKVSPNEEEEPGTKCQLSTQLPHRGLYQAEDSGQLNRGILFIQEKNEILIHATIWMNLKNNILSERSQAKAAYSMIPFTMSRRGKPKGIDQSNWGLEWGDNEDWLLMHTGFLFGVMIIF